MELGMATKRWLLVKTMMIFDLIVMSAAFGLATWNGYEISDIGSDISFDYFLSIRVKVANLLLMLGILFCWHLLFLANGLYRSHRLSSALNVTLDILVTTLLASLLLYLVGLVFKVSLISLPFLAMFWLFSSATLVLSRMVLRSVLRQFRARGRNLRDIAVVGTNARARAFVDMVKSMPDLGYRFIGYVDDRDDDAPPHDDLDILANYNQFEDFMRTNVLDEIVVFSPLRSQYDKIGRVVELAEAQGIIVRFGTNPFPLKIGRSVVEQVGNVTVSTVQTGSMYGHPALAAKAALDFLVAAVLLLLLSPLFMIVSILVKLESPGPVFFVQPRLGLNKRLFNLYKFRSMRADAEQLQASLEAHNEVDGPVFKIQDDPRITRLGKFLRKTSIDELPQLLNVLRGDMSLVGPRPLPVRDFEGFEIDKHRRRFSVKPGITCLWQISGRSNISFDKWMELDMNYIDHWTLWLDLKILLKTIPAVLNRTGAK